MWSYDRIYLKLRIGCTFCCSEGAHFLMFLNIQQPWNIPAFAFSLDRGQVNIAMKIMKHDTNPDTASNGLKQNWDKTYFSVISFFILLYIILSFLPPWLNRPKFTFFLGRFLGKKKQIQTLIKMLNLAPHIFIACFVDAFNTLDRKCFATRFKNVLETEILAFYISCVFNRKKLWQRLKDSHHSFT